MLELFDRLYTYDHVSVQILQGFIIAVSQSKPKFQPHTLPSVAIAQDMVSPSVSSAQGHPLYICTKDPSSASRIMGFSLPLFKAECPSGFPRWLCAFGE